MNLWEKAFDALEYVDPTTYMSNHNSQKSDIENGFGFAQLAMIDIHDELDAFCLSLDSNQRKALNYLEDNYWVYFKLNPTSTYLIISDVFGYAYADMEEVSPDDYVELQALSEKFGYHGVIAWVASKRGTTPIEPRITDEYKKAIRYLRRKKEASWPAKNN